MCRTTWHIVIPAPEDATPNALHDDASPVVCMVECALRGNDVPAVQASDIAVGCLESSRWVMRMRNGDDACDTPRLHVSGIYCMDCFTATATGTCSVSTAAMLQRRVTPPAPLLGRRTGRDPPAGDVFAACRRCRCNHCMLRQRCVSGGVWWRCCCVISGVVRGAASDMHALLHGECAPPLSCMHCV